MTAITATTKTRQRRSQAVAAAIAPAPSPKLTVAEQQQRKSLARLAMLRQSPELARVKMEGSAELLKERAREIDTSPPVLVDPALHDASAAKLEQDMARAYDLVYGFTEEQVKEWRAAWEAEHPTAPVTSPASAAILSAVRPPEPPAFGGLDEEQEDRFRIALESPEDEDPAETAPDTPAVPGDNPDDPALDEVAASES